MILMSAFTFKSSLKHCFDEGTKKINQERKKKPIKHIYYQM